jgi:hypothetical protein
LSKIILAMDCIPFDLADNRKSVDTWGLFNRVSSTVLRKNSDLESVVMRQLVYALLIGGVLLLAMGIGVIAASARPLTFHMPPEDSAFVGLNSCTECHDTSHADWDSAVHAETIIQTRASLNGVAGILSVANTVFHPNPGRAAYGPACASCHMPQATHDIHFGDLSTRSVKIFLLSQAAQDNPESCAGCHAPASPDESTLTRALLN